MAIDISKHKALFYGITVGLFSLACIATGPLYEVYVDIGVSPPQNIRRTDFSWITVNEWFTTQTCIITSYNTLKDVESNIGVAKLRDIISARRLDSADIIRISARSEADPFAMQEVIAKITSAYLKRLNGTDAVKPLPDEAEKINGPEEFLKEDREELGALQANRGRIEEKIDAEKSKLTMLEKELSAIENSQPNIKELRSRIAALNGQIAVMTQKYSSLKTTYADAWPEVSKLKAEIVALQKEREGYSQVLADGLLTAASTQGRKNQLNSDIGDSRQTLGALRQEIASIDDRIGVIIHPAGKSKNKEIVKEEAIPQEERMQGYVLNPPTINFLPELWGRLLFGFLFGTFFWHIIYLIFTKKFAPASENQAYVKK